MKKEKSGGSLNRPPKFVWFLIAAAIVFLVVVQVLFSLPAPADIFKAPWGAGDLLSFVGTMALGVIAVHQTWKANEVSRRLMDLEVNRYRLETRPFIMVEDWIAELGSWRDVLFSTGNNVIYIGLGKHENQGKDLLMKIHVINTTQSFVQVNFKEIKHVWTNEKIDWNITITDVLNRRLRLQSGEGGDLIYWGDAAEIVNFTAGKLIRFSFMLENRFGEQYQEDIDTFIHLITDLPGKDSLYLEMDVQNYRIGKFEKMNGKAEVAWEEER